jgi:hypothetical protein
MKYLLFLLTTILFITVSAAQPGPNPEALYFKVFVQGKNVLEDNYVTYEIQYRNVSDNKNNWSICTVVLDTFKTEKIKKHRGATEIKIYKKYSNDTMFISCHDNINFIPFTKGIFVLDKSTNYLANMQTFNGVKINNQNWDNYRENNNGNINYLTKNRYCYYSKDTAPDEEDETDVKYISHKKSEHLIEKKGEVVQDYISLGKLYYAPQISRSVYSIGYVNTDNTKGEKYSQYLLESTDDCKSWKIKFSLHDNNADLITIKNSNFIISNTYPQNQLLTYNAKGKIIDSLKIDEEPCANEQNIFYPCEQELKQTNSAVEISSPLYESGNNFSHIFCREFSNGTDVIRIDELPYNPRSIIASFGKDAEWKKILELNSKETYVYVTARKNKVVIVSYNYTMTSNDFGKTFAFYSNGTFNNGQWNFIWLDDNTLANVTNYYADVFEIL